MINDSSLLRGSEASFWRRRWSDTEGENEKEVRGVLFVPPKEEEVGAEGESGRLVGGVTVNIVVRIAVSRPLALKED